jgi:hypothetical protein
MHHRCVSTATEALLKLRRQVGRARERLKVRELELREIGRQQKHGEGEVEDEVEDEDAEAAAAVFLEVEEEEEDLGEMVETSTRHMPDLLQVWNIGKTSEPNERA